jgi:hypothetical protein
MERRDDSNKNCGGEAIKTAEVAPDSTDEFFVVRPKAC